MSEHARLVKLALTPGLLPGERRTLDWCMGQFDGGDDCGSWASSGGPCGGCSRCCQQQASYYVNQAADRRRRAALLGLLIAPQQIDRLPTGSMPCCSVDSRLSYV